MENQHHHKIPILPGSHNGKNRRSAGTCLRIMKFGGTSLADAASISKVTDLIETASQAGNLVVVVSAMSGVTNKLIEAAKLAETGRQRDFGNILEELRHQHESAIYALIHSVSQRDLLIRHMKNLLGEANRLCQGTMLLRELT